MLQYVPHLNCDFSRITEINEQKSRFEMPSVQVGHDRRQTLQLVFVIVEAKLKAKTTVCKKGKPKNFIAMNFRNPIDCWEIF